MYAPLAFADDAAVPVPTPAVSGELATTMVLRGAAGVLIGAAVAPRGHEGTWAAAGFVAGALLGEYGIGGLAFAALWKKAA